ncbi:ParB/RepB/Spo0J family partition protein [bacterium]|jgi:hypothetical protein|nr:ParB/RepB/Spo0J family partition protein [bacterium]
MKNLKLYEDYTYNKKDKVTKKYLSDICSVIINDNEYILDEDELIDFFHSENIKPQKIDINKLYKFSTIYNLNNCKVKNKYTDNKWINYNNLPKNLQDKTTELQEDRIKKGNINHPIIVVHFNNGNYEILEGNHRTIKSKRTEQKTINAYVLNENDLLIFIKDGKIIPKN